MRSCLFGNDLKNITIMHIALKLFLKIESFFLKKVEKSLLLGMSLSPMQ